MGCRSLDIHAELEMLLESAKNLYEIEPGNKALKIVDFHSDWQGFTHTPEYKKRFTHPEEDSIIYGYQRYGRLLKIELNQAKLRNKK